MAHSINKKSNSFRIQLLFFFNVKKIKSRILFWFRYLSKIHIVYIALIHGSVATINTSLKEGITVVP